MLKPDITQLARIMVQTLQNMAEEGELPPGDHRFEDVFGFGADDIEGIHTHKTGHGDGVWFRLKSSVTAKLCDLAICGQCRGTTATTVAWPGERPVPYCPAMRQPTGKPVQRANRRIVMH